MVATRNPVSSRTSSRYPRRRRVRAPDGFQAADRGTDVAPAGLLGLIPARPTRSRKGPIMTLCKILLSGSALCTIALLAAATGPQKAGQGEPSKPVEAASPKITPEHTMLKKMVGTWTAT